MYCWSGALPCCHLDDEYVQVSLRMIKELGSDEFLVNMQFLAQQHARRSIQCQKDGMWRCRYEHRGYGNWAISSADICRTNRWLGGRRNPQGGPARFMKNFVKEFKATMKGCTTSPQMGALLSALQRSD